MKESKMKMNDFQQRAVVELAMANGHGWANVLTAIAPYRRPGMTWVAVAETYRAHMAEVDEAGAAARAIVGYDDGAGDVVDAALKAAWDAAYTDGRRGLLPPGAIEKMAAHVLIADGDEAADWARAQGMVEGAWGGILPRQYDVGDDGVIVWATAGSTRLHIGRDWIRVDRYAAPAAWGQASTTMTVSVFITRDGDDWVAKLTRHDGWADGGGTNPYEMDRVAQYAAMAAGADRAGGRAIATGVRRAWAAAQAM